MSEPIFSVVVCTYNHAELLTGALDSLYRQTLEPSRYETVVVDNNSTDGTREAIRAHTERHPGLRYCFEAAQGISHARNCGVRHARGLYVAYLDDDCRPPEEWLAVAEDIVKQVSPMAMGGPYHTAFEGSRPRWVSDTFNSYIPFREPRLLARDEYGSLVGGNVFFRRAVFDIIGGFDPDLGHVGNTVTYGEETAVLERVSLHFPGSLYYDPRLYVKHVVRPEKLTLGYTVRAAFGAGRSGVRRRQTQAAHGATRILGEVAYTSLALAADLLVRMPLRDRRTHPYARSYFHDRSLNYVRQLGALYERSRRATRPEARADLE